jgi:hypothetical protein
MEPATTFKPKMKGMEGRILFEYEDERSKCYLGYAGWMPELRGYAFYYNDDTYEFCFYANCKYDGDTTYDVVVNHATTQRFHGGFPRIDPADIDRIRRNMEKFFSTRAFLVPSEPIPPTVDFRNLILSWRLP